jgi:capsular polysaccharide transport system ATP-binding protein
MIVVQNVTKQYKIRSGIKTVLDNVSFTVSPSERIGILGVNGSGKSTIIRLIGGVEKPTSGKIERTMTVSWPIGISGGLLRTLSGIDNLKLICRIYNKPIDENRAFLEEFTELGRYLYEPVASYSTGMRTKLGLGISLMLDFDCYLIDEALAVGDKNLQNKYKEIQNKRKTKSMIFVSHSERQIKENCETVYVLRNGCLTKYDHPDPAIEFYNSIKTSNK